MKGCGAVSIGSDMCATFEVEGAWFKLQVYHMIQGIRSPSSTWGGVCAEGVLEVNLWVQ